MGFRSWTALLAIAGLVLPHPAAAATIVVDSASCTLSDAITAANSDQPAGGCPAGNGADILDLTADVVLTDIDNEDDDEPNGLPLITGDVTVRGGDFVISRAAEAPPFRIFHVASGTLALNDVTVRRGAAVVAGGSGTGTGGALKVQSGATAVLTRVTLEDNSAERGGAIGSVAGSVIVVDSRIQRNQAERGAGIASMYSVELTLDGAHVVDNQGAGVLATAGSVSDPVTAVDTVVRGNSAGGFSLRLQHSDVICIRCDVSENGGSAVDVFGYGTVTIADSTIAGNTGQPAIRGFTPSSGLRLELDDTTVRDNDAGGFEIRSGDARIANSRFLRNRSDGSGAAIDIGSFSSLVLTHSTVSGNVSRGYGGGALAVLTTVGGFTTIRDTVFEDNVAENGLGGAFWFLGKADVDGCRFANNVAQGVGGAIAGFSLGPPGMYPDGLRITRSTFVGNAAAVGGAIWSDAGIALSDSALLDNLAAEQGGGAASGQGAHLAATNTTLSGNAAGDRGGALFAEGPTTLQHVTITDNQAAAGAGVYVDPAIAKGLHVRGSIVAGQRAGGNCVGTATDGGANFDDDGSCPGAQPIVAGTDFDAVPQNNGGTTPTHALPPASVARNAAGACGLDADQRGVPRLDGSCDSGAYELVEGACCAPGHSDPYECVVTDQHSCEAQRGFFLGAGAECVTAPQCRALAAEMQRMHAVRTPAGVEISWVTAYEIDAAAFRILRESGHRKTVTDVSGLIPSRGSSVVGAAYRFVDQSRRGDGATRYYIEEIDVFGRATRHGPIEVVRSRRHRPPPHR